MTSWMINRTFGCDRGIFYSSQMCAKFFPPLFPLNSLVTFQRRDATGFPAFQLRESSVWYLQHEIKPCTKKKRLTLDTELSWQQVKSKSVKPHKKCQHYTKYRRVMLNKTKPCDFTGSHKDKDWKSSYILLLFGRLDKHWALTCLHMVPCLFGDLVWIFIIFK